MGKYKEMLKDIKSKGGSNYSKSDQVALMQSLINDPEHEASIYSKASDGSAKETKIKPSQDFREKVIKKALTDAGMDKQDAADAVEKYEINKDGAESVVTLGMIAMRDYLDTGRKVVLPTTTPDSATMSVSIQRVEEKVEATKKIEQQPDGSYASVPTGKTIKTESYEKLIAKNKVPGYLKSEV